MSNDKAGILISCVIALVTVTVTVRSQSRTHTVEPQVGWATRADPWLEIATEYSAALPAGYRQDIHALTRLLTLRWAYLEMRGAGGEVDIGRSSP